MGKHRTIKILAGIIGGMAAHKILVQYTNKPESINHLESEVNNYERNAFEYAEEFNWNDEDLAEIKQEALFGLERELRKPHFQGVVFPKDKTEEIVSSIMSEIFE